MSEPLTASALRQEGPQQELPNVTKRLEHLTVQLKGWCDCGGEGCNLCCGARTAVDAAMEIVKLRAALSASRTAQAPQQEELARTTLICAAHMLDACAENMEKLCVGYGAEQMRGIAQRLREGTPTLEQACTADDLKKAQARIQVLETSVDYLRNLIDHPVTQQDTKTEI